MPGNAAKVFTHLAEAKVVVNDIIQTEISPEKANLSFMVGTVRPPTAQRVAVEQT